MIESKEAVFRSLTVVLCLLFHSQFITALSIDHLLKQS